MEIRKPIFRQLLQEDIHSVGHMKSDRTSFQNINNRDLERESWHLVGGDVGLLVAQSYRN